MNTFHEHTYLLTKLNNFHWRMSEAFTLIKYAAGTIQHKYVCDSDLSGSIAATKDMKDSGVGLGGGHEHHGLP